MQRTKPASNAGQLNPCTSFGASISMAIETAILTISHNMKLTALAPGDMLLRRLVMPRAISAPGTTTHDDHAPRIEWRLLGAQGRRFLPGQRLEGRQTSPFFVVLPPHAAFAACGFGGSGVWGVCGDD